MRSLILFSALVFLTISCSIQKRVHRPGWTVSWNKDYRSEGRNSSVKVEEENIAINVQDEIPSQNEPDLIEVNDNPLIEENTFVVQEENTESRAKIDFEKDISMPRVHKVSERTNLTVKKVKSQKSVKTKQAKKHGINSLEHNQADQHWVLRGFGWLIGILGGVIASSFMFHVYLCLDYEWIPDDNKSEYLNTRKTFISSVNRSFVLGYRFFYEAMFYVFLAALLVLVYIFTGLAGLIVSLIVAGLLILLIMWICDAMMPYLFWTGR